MKRLFSLSYQGRILLSSVSGTICMTAYIYILSTVRGKNFKEPKLLGKMSRHLLPWIDDNKTKTTGCLMHYLVGLLFAEVYAPFWPVSAESKSYVKTGLVLGGISGIAAILLWKFTLKHHPLPPAVDFLPFAGQLFIAHILFGCFAAIGFLLPGLPFADL